MSQPEKPTILFVDDDENLLQGLKVSLRQERKRWNILYANSGPEGLELFEENEVTLVVSDIRMPVMNGAEFLTAVRERSPRTIRFVLTGEAGEEVVQKALAVTDRWLTKPCDRDTLVQAIDEGLAANSKREPPELERLLERAGRLPSAPDALASLQGALADPNISIAELTDKVASDPGLAAEMLRLANSVTVGARVRVDNLSQAVSHLGTSLLQQLVLARELFSPLDSQFPACRESHGLLIERSRLLLATLTLLHTEGPVPRSLSTIALLCETGRCVFLREYGEMYQEVLESPELRSSPLHRLEQETFGVHQADLGAALLSRWNLPEEISDSVGQLYKPTTRDGAYLHVAFCASEAIQRRLGRLGRCALIPERSAAQEVLTSDTFPDFVERLSRALTLATGEEAA